VPPLTKLRWSIWCAAALILAFQLFVPPIVGLSDQGDFSRIISRFGYARGDGVSPVYAYVSRKYVHDPHQRNPGIEQPSSEYIFVGSALLLNKVVSKDGRLDIRVMGLVHAAAFLAVFARLLSVIGRAMGALRIAAAGWITVFVWITAAVALTDVGYAAYWNSFYTEPASCIFFLLLLAESIAICASSVISPAQIGRWCLWAALLVTAKLQNVPLILVLAPFALRLGWRSKLASARYLAVAGSIFIVSCGIVSIRTSSPGNAWADTYNQIFMAILPESKDPAADLTYLGIDPRFVTYAGTGAFTPRTAIQELVTSRVIGARVTPATLAGFYLRHPLRMWRRAKVLLPIAFSLRPEWCGNFEQSTGYPNGAQSYAFAVWNQFHQRFLAPIGKPILILLLIAPLAAIVPWVRMPARRLQIELCVLLVLGCLAAFAVAAFGDAWDNVKHCFLFNLQLDAALIATVCLLAGTAERAVTSTMTSTSTTSMTTRPTASPTTS
jgi:hypothetical protein